MKRDIISFLRPNIRALTPYSTARDEFKGVATVFVDANESAYDNGYNRYPDPRQKRLKEVVSALEGVATENLFLGNGSDEAIDLMFRMFCRPGIDNAVTVEPTYGMYEVAAAINDVEIRKVRLDENFGLDPERLLEATDESTRLVLLCSPNNPTGRSVPRADIVSIAEHFEGIVVVDEAYIHYSPAQTMTGLIGDYNNIVVLRTLSKGRALAGLRVGMAIADPLVIEVMSRVKYPYNISQATIDKALEIIARNESDGQIAATIEARPLMAKRLNELKAVKKVYPSDANFLLVEVDDANRLYDYLATRGIIVRNRTNVPGCHNCLRITIGLPEENDKIIAAVKDYEKETADN